MAKQLENERETERQKENERDRENERQSEKENEREVSLNAILGTRVSSSEPFKPSIVSKTTSAVTDDDALVHLYPRLCTLVSHHSDTRILGRAIL
jgi:hypothetical protein